MVHRLDTQLVILFEPRHLVAALIRPGVRDFDLHIAASA
jgi:hypothetical protein